MNSNGIAPRRRQTCASTVSVLNWQRAFQDPLGIERLDERKNHDEERTILLAIVDGVVLLVVSTPRTDGIRLISARKANRHEQNYYYRENGS